MINLDFYYFTFSTYLLMIGIAFIIGFILFHHISKKDYDKIDLMYIYVINILGFGLGAKLLSFIESGKKVTVSNFFESGYAFIGGILGSIFLIFLYCKKYKLSFYDVLSKFSVIYPLIYSISKIGCFLNGCCEGTIINIPIQIADCIVMLLLTIILLVAQKKRNDLTGSIFFIGFGTFRFIEDFFRVSRRIFLYRFSLTQWICIVFVISSIFLYVKGNRGNKSITCG